MSTKREAEWISRYEALMMFAREVAVSISERNSCARSSSRYAELTVPVKSGLAELDKTLNELRQELLRSASAFRITQGERERRDQLLEVLGSKIRILKESASGSDYRGASARDELFRTTMESRVETVGWEGQRLEASEDEQSRQRSLHEIQQRKKELLRAQDEGIEALAESIRRQRSVAASIGTEVEEQNDLIVNIADGMDQTRERLLRETVGVQVVSRRSEGTWKYWLIIIILFIANVVVAFW